jgi:pentatricopeptide repeat protein
MTYSRTQKIPSNSDLRKEGRKEVTLQSDCLASKEEKNNVKEMRFIAALLTTTTAITTIRLSLASNNSVTLAAAFLPFGRQNVGNVHKIPRDFPKRRQKYTTLTGSSFFPTTGRTVVHYEIIDSCKTFLSQKQQQEEEDDDEMVGDDKHAGEISTIGTCVLSNAFYKLEQNYRGKYVNKPQKRISREIIQLFQSVQNRQALEALTCELVDSVTVSRAGEEMSLTKWMLPTDQTFLINLLGSRHCYDAMMKLLRHFTKHLSVRDAQYAYTAAIRSFSQSSNESIRVRAIDLIDEMDARGIPPNSYVFTAAFLSVDGGKAAMQLLKKAQTYQDDGHVEIGVHLYNACIHACSRQCGGKNGWQNALALFRREMPRRGIQPNEDTYASLLHACANAGQLRVVFTILDEMRKSESRRYLSSNGNKIWSAILRACATAGDGTMAMQIMKQMLQSGIQPSTLDCNSVLAALAKESRETGSGSVAVALEFLERLQGGDLVRFFFEDGECPMGEGVGMINVDVPIDIISINTVLKAFANAGDDVGAKLLMDRLRRGEFMGALDANTGKRFAIHPDIISYNTVLSVCPNSQEAIDIMNEVSTFVWFSESMDTHIVHIRYSQTKRP